MKEVLSIILGGGRGTRLYPLTKYRAKPAVPLAGKYRLIDIPISNCLNSGLNKILILTQFNSASLNRHIFRAYKFDHLSDGFVEVAAAEQSVEYGDWFQGSADAVRKSYKHFNDPRIKHLIILSGDQLYKMNIMDMFKFHLEKESEVTVACNPVGMEEAEGLGIMGINKDSQIRKFVEKPKKNEEVSDLAIQDEGRKKFLSSMGIYIFNKDILMRLLKDASKVDFGREIIPEAVNVCKTYAFIHHGYWRDIGSIPSFYEENLAFAQDHPPLDLFDEEWHFFTRPRHLPLSKFSDCHIENSSIADGVIAEKSKIIHSIIGLRSKIGSDTVIKDSVLMGNDYYGSGKAASTNPAIGKNCLISKSIVDKNVRIGDNVKLVNENSVMDYEDEYCVIRNGIIIIPKGTIIPSGTVI
ncbi:MAG: glucose-1-phosphate adenylyltransferase [Candidatus Omnitrophica bacterium]|nr:glucose-1-phosphate adenylyltransferase [Candidatus Omnitrophota bacterium]MBU1928705.1 glucose-1-phosphate adenylyltransferase [Candidatus Omnitrophota bacterium]MBU2034693.1 glucose-1-phosphate adenylyltransferase [Candidatus Omnitrophota bacterium]MBU2221032.1 glucose-1-phosphate adenylyltransferase [Candidatus Omnitrophota bacterium]